MSKQQLSKQIFGVPSLATATAIDNSDKVQALRAAGYRYETRLSELERQFEAKASELRGAYPVRSRRLTATHKDHKERDGQALPTPDRP